MGNHPVGDDGPCAGKTCLTYDAKFTRQAVILHFFHMFFSWRIII
jgi:hypothetical protein